MANSIIFGTGNGLRSDGPSGEDTNSRINETRIKVVVGSGGVAERTESAMRELNWYPEDTEIGWRLARNHWSQGYATEAATAWLKHAFVTLHLPRVISVADLQNVRSLAVMHRLGMVFDHHAELSENGHTFQAVVHSITGEHWHSPGEWLGCTCAADST